MNRMRYVLISILAFYLVGCASGKLYQGKVFSNDFFSIKWNSKQWSLASDSQQSSAWVNHGSGGDSRSIWVDVYYKNVRANLGFRSQAYLTDENQIFLPGSSIFFDKGSDYKEVSREDDGLPKMMTHNHGGKRVYHPKWEKLTYVYGMKCLHNVFIQLGAGVIKKYKIYCGYYDENENRRILLVSLSYDRIAHYNQWSKLELLKEPPSIQPLEDHLKNAVEHLVATLEIKNFDRARMKSEGLFHPNRQFQLLEY